MRAAASAGTAEANSTAAPLPTLGPSTAVRAGDPAPPAAVLAAQRRSALSHASKSLAVSALRTAANRRPNLEGAEHVDRRAVYTAMKWHRTGRRPVPPLLLGYMRTVICGAATLQKPMAECAIISEHEHMDESDGCVL